MPTSPHVFVSHSSQDHALAVRFVADLERAGVPCWIAPRDIAPGEDYGSAILTGLRTSRAVLLLLSAEANRSEQVGREVERAVHYTVPILPVRIGPRFDLSARMEYFVSSSQWVDHDDSTHAAIVDTLLGRVRTLADAAAASSIRGAADPDDAVVTAARRVIEAGSGTTPRRQLLDARDAAIALCRAVDGGNTAEGSIGGPTGALDIEGWLTRLGERIPIKVQVPLRTIHAYSHLTDSVTDDDSVDTGFIRPAVQALTAVVDWYRDEWRARSPRPADAAPSASGTDQPATPASAPAAAAGPAPTVTPPEPPTAPSTSTPARDLVGRVEERRAISAFVDQVRAGGQGGGICLVGGESGSGKTAVMEALLAYAEQGGMRIARTSCEPFHEGMSFFPIRELVRLLASERGAAHDIGRAFGTESTQAQLARLVDASDADPAARRDATVATFANQAFARVAIDQRPLTVFVDDLERVDAASVDALTCLAARLREGPVLLLGAYRNDVVSDAGSSTHPLRPLLAMARRADRLMRLGPLKPGEVLDLVASILDGPMDLPPTFKRRLQEETEGNPLYVREVLRGLMSGTDGEPAPLRQVDGVWRLVRSAESWEIPRSIEDALLHRLNALNDADRAVVEMAAIIGRRFVFPVLAALSDLDETALIESLERLLECELIREARGADDLFEFSHGKVREVLHTGMSGLRRQRLHGRVADVLLADRGTLPADEWEVLVASHLFSARRYEAAVPYLVRAGERALRLEAGVEAVQHFRRALEATERAGSTDHVHIDSLRLRLGEALKLATEHDAAEQQFKMLLRDGTDDVAKRWALDHLGDLALIRGRVAEALERYSDCERLAREAGDTELLAEAAADLAELHMRQAERLAGLSPADAEHHQAEYNRYLELEQDLAPQVGKPAMLARAYRNSAKRARTRGHVDVAIALYEQSLQHIDAGVNSHQFLIPYAKALRLVDRHQDALEVVLRVRDWSQQLGALRSQGIARQYQGLIAMEMALRSGSDLASAREHLEAALALHHDVGFEQGRRETEIDLGELHAHLGDLWTSLGHLASAIGTDVVSDDVSIARAALAQLQANGEVGRAERLASTLEALGLDGLRPPPGTD